MQSALGGRKKRPAAEALGGVAETPRRFTSVRSCAKGRVTPVALWGAVGPVRLNGPLPATAQRATATLFSAPASSGEIAPIHQPFPWGAVDCRPRPRPPSGLRWSMATPAMACELTVVNTGRGTAFMPLDSPFRNAIPKRRHYLFLLDTVQSTTRLKMAMQANGKTPLPSERLQPGRGY